MKSMLSFWRGEIARAPIVLVPLAALAVTLVMNARTGYRLGNDSLEIAGVLVAIGLGGAYAGATLWHLPWGARRVGLAAVLAVALVVDQMSAWQTLGISFADGGVARQSRATGLETINERLGARRAERKGLGEFRAVDALVPLEARECKLAPKGIDPVGARCTSLREELGKARRALVLDKEIEDLAARLEGREQVAGGAPQFSVPVAIAQAAATHLWGSRAPTVTAEHITFFLLMLLAAAVGVLANLGFWLFGVGHEGRPAGGEDDGSDDLGRFARALPPPPRYRALEPFDAPRDVTLQPSGDGRGGSATATASPIQIFVGGERGEARAANDEAPQAPSVRAPEPPPARPRHDLAALSAEAPPIDRSRVRRELTEHEREAADVLLAFRAQCMVDAPGAHLSAATLYRRYQDWAGERALDEQAFLALLPDVTGVDVVSVSGVPHARGCVLRLAGRRAAGAA